MLTTTRCVDGTLPNTWHVTMMVKTTRRQASSLEATCGQVPGSMEARQCAAFSLRCPGVMSVQRTVRTLSAADLRLPSPPPLSYGRHGTSTGHAGQLSWTVALWLGRQKQPHRPTPCTPLQPSSSAPPTAVVDPAPGASRGPSLWLRPSSIFHPRAPSSSSPQVLRRVKECVAVLRAGSLSDTLCLHPTGSIAVTWAGSSGCGPSGARLLGTRGVLHRCTCQSARGFAVSAGATFDVLAAQAQANTRPHGPGPSHH